jgi:DNA-binding GntR family transcriptional regulator
MRRLGDSSTQWLAEATLGFSPLFESIEQHQSDAAAAAARNHAAASMHHLRQFI